MQSLLDLVHSREVNVYPKGPGMNHERHKGREEMQD